MRFHERKSYSSYYPHIGGGEGYYDEQIIFIITNNIYQDNYKILCNTFNNIFYLFIIYSKQLVNLKFKSKNHIARVCTWFNLRASRTINISSIFAQKALEPGFILFMFLIDVSVFTLTTIHIIVILIILPCLGHICLNLVYQYILHCK